MSVERLLAQVEAAGGRFEVHGDALDVEAPRPLPAELVAALKAHKPEILAVLDGCPRCRRSRAAGIYVLMCGCGYESPETRARLARAPEETEGRLLEWAEL